MDLISWYYQLFRFLKTEKIDIIMRIYYLLLIQLITIYYSILEIVGPVFEIPKKISITLILILFTITILFDVWISKNKELRLWTTIEIRSYRKRSFITRIFYILILVFPFLFYLVALFI